MTIQIYILWQIHIQRAYTAAEQPTVIQQKFSGQQFQKATSCFVRESMAVFKIMSSDVSAADPDSLSENYILRYQKIREQFPVTAMRKCSRSCREMVRTFPATVSFSRSRQSNILTFAFWTGQTFRPSHGRQPIDTRIVIWEFRPDPTLRKAQGECHPMDAFDIAFG
ncbi:MAG: hypothetical protein V7661_09565 [Sulfitobacter sp.]